MDNPVKEGTYTTIFADGSIILYNQWMMFDNPSLNKWYFNELPRGGVIHWFEPPEDKYKEHKWYKLPDWEVRELLKNALKYEAVDTYASDTELIGNAIDRYTAHYGAINSMVEQELEKYYKGYEVND